MSDPLFKHFNPHIDPFLVVLHSHLLKSEHSILLVKELNNGEGRRLSRGRSDPVQSSLPDVDKVKVFVVL